MPETIATLAEAGVKVRGLQPFCAVWNECAVASRVLCCRRTHRVVCALRRQIWMLTGDKSETAVNIGFATQMLTNDMELLLLTRESLGADGMHSSVGDTSSFSWIRNALCLVRLSCT